MKLFRKLKQKVSMIQSNSHFLDDEPRCQFQPRCQFKELTPWLFFIPQEMQEVGKRLNYSACVRYCFSLYINLSLHLASFFLNGWWESDSRLLSSLMMSHNTVSSIGNIYQTWLIKNSIWISQVQRKHLWCNQNLTNNSNRANCYSN